MDLSIVIVNWISAAFLRECLRSIYATPTFLRFEVIVIDNASFDGSEMMVRREFPWVEFIQSRKNLGFAGANNIAFARSSGRDLPLRNPDTELTGHALTAMCSVLDTMSDAGVVGCKLLNSDLSVQTSCIQAFPTILNQALDSDFLYALFPKSSLWGMRALYEPGIRPAVVDMVSGACLMIRRTVFEQVGQFSTDYFMYTEDMDLCYRGAHAGWRDYFVGGATVIHHGGRSAGTRSNDFAVIMMRESKLTFMRAQHGRTYALYYQSSSCVIAFARLFVLAAGMVAAVGKSRRQEIRRSFGKWLKILRWSVGLESWAKTHTQSAG